MKHCNLFGWMLAVILMWPVGRAVAVDASQRPRVIVTTDGEVDDRCSMIRFLLYTNDWNVRGLIHSSSKYHWIGNDTVERHDWHDVAWLEKQLDAYAAVYPKLKQHDPAYPSPDELRGQVFVGNIESEGDMRMATPGSNRIVEILLDPDPSPVWLQAWGGSNTIARALKTIQEQYPDRSDEVAAKAKIYLISQQDKTFKEYIRTEWPNVDVLLSNGDAFGAIAYGWGKLQPPEVKEYFGRVWMREHVLQKHGPLLDMYEHKDLRFRSEGDSPAFLHLINTGLRSDEDPTYGGWGGRFIKAGDHYWKSSDGKDQSSHSILRWAIDFQNDWAARSDWCVTTFTEANHPPVISLETAGDIVAKPGESIHLAAIANDPDGDLLSFRWWQYEQAGTCQAKATIDDASKPQATIRIPDSAGNGETLHLICEVKDQGSPPLTRYRRVIVTCANNEAR